VIKNWVKCIFCFNLLVLGWSTKFRFRETISSYFAKLFFTKSQKVTKFREISRNFCDEIKFLTGQDAFLNLLAFQYYEKNCMSKIQKHFYWSGSISYGTDPMIGILAKIAWIQNTGKNRVVITAMIALVSSYRQYDTLHRNSMPPPPASIQYL
jgi:hypothetical protein